MWGKLLVVVVVVLSAWVVSGERGDRGPGRSCSVVPMNPPPPLNR